jgi:hypothetical protein
MHIYIYTYTHTHNTPSNPKHPYITYNKYSMYIYIYPYNKFHTHAFMCMYIRIDTFI